MSEMRTMFESTIEALSTRRFATTLLAGVLVAGSALPSQALTSSEIRCRDVASQFAREAAANTLTYRMGCIRRRVHDGLSLTVDCAADPEELGGSGTGDLETDRRLANLAFLRQEAADELVSVCDGPDDMAPSDIDPVDVALDTVCPGGAVDWQEVGPCVVDLGIRSIDNIMELFDLQVDSRLRPSHLRCIGDVAKQIKRTMGTLARYRSVCFSKDDQLANGGGVLDCGATIMPFGLVEAAGDATVDKRLGEPFVRLDDQLRRKCDLPIDELGFEGAIPDVTGGRFTDRTTLDDVIHGLNDQIQEAVHAVSFGTDGTDGLFPVAVRGGYCGDGVSDAGEACDDGNNTSCDGCDRDCTLSTCGNGAVCGPDGEECDDGNNVSGDGCSATCISERCMNGKVNPGYDEDCDDGSESFTCDTDCTWAICGDGYNNAVRGEVCDTGIGAPLDTVTCDSDCTAPACPDGHFNPFNVAAPALPSGEECDDGGNSPGCDANCTLASCGDAYLNPVRGEACDDGNNDVDDSCVSSDDVPRSNCQVAFCGDGFHCTDGTCTSGPSGAAEVCDDGTGTPGSARSAFCDSDCSLPVCGDANLNPEAGEACDNGPALTTNAHPCTGSCRVAICGDANVCNAGSCTSGPSGGAEQCDDGDYDNRDSCRNNCAAALCGDGVVCSGLDCTSGPTGGVEECDAAGQTAICDTDCSVAFCGDSQTNAANGEACDTGGNSLTCDNDCTAAQCRDGYLNTAANEDCDDGNNVNTDRCTNACDVASCGDSILCSNGACNTAGLGPEQCDAGGETALCDLNCTTASCGDGDVNLTRGEECDASGESADCDANCTARYCGDGTANATAGETCDDGDDNNNDLCPDNVTAGGTCLTATCGDGFLCTDGACNTGGAGPETCDDGNGSPNDPCPSGVTGTCIVATCGDGFLCSAGGCTTGPGASTEECDNGGANSDVAPNACRTNCAAASCGDGVTDAGEACDDGAGNGTGEGFCLSDCSGVQTCGDSAVEGTETCDDGDAEQCGACNATCSGAGVGAVVCGDGFTCGGGYGETCDDGDDQQCGTCNATCNGAGIGAVVCGDGVTCGDAYGEECDDGGVSPSDGCSALCLDERVVFQTAATFTPGVDFTSIATANALCQTAASGAGLLGTYAAWLSDSTTSPSTSFVQGAGPYMLTTGTYIATSWADLTDGTLATSISRDQLGNVAGGGTSACTTVFTESAVWSNTAADGTLLDGANTCSDWSSNVGALVNSGDAAQTGANWTESCLGASCAAAENLYCFQQ